tara:strand:- start:520 stop:687 length:168 start_codon:yes stop_codon:yes gene_type:complete
MKQYTRQEVDSIMLGLLKQEKSLLSERDKLNRDIEKVRDNIKFYLELDESQLKMF